jgi:hypothetical protein
MSAPDVRAVVYDALRTVQGTKHHLGLVTLQVLTDRVTEAVTGLVAEVTRANAALIEDAACDADWEKSPDYCTGLRAGAELLLAKAGKASPKAATTPDFFQPGHTYTREHHAATIRFLVRYVDASPCGTYRVAFGWRIEDGDVTWSPFDSDDMGGWVDVTEAGGRHA